MSVHQFGSAEYIAEIERLADGDNYEVPIAGDWLKPSEVCKTPGAAPYPVESMPAAMAQAVNTVVEAGQMPVPIAAGSALAGLSLAGQHLANVARDKNLICPCSLSILSLAISGERKSAADKRMSAAIRAWADDKNYELRDAAAEAEADLAAWTQEKSGIESAIRKASTGKAKPSERGLNIDALKHDLKALMKNKPAEFAMPELFHEDSTPEGLAWHVAIGWPSQALWSDEGSLIFGGHGMRAESALAFLALLNRLWDGGTFKPTRKIAETREIRGKRLTANIMVQPDLLMELLQKTMARGIGFLARFLIAWPESTMGTRMYREPPHNDIGADAFGTRLRAMLDIPPVLNERDELTPPVLHLSADGKRVWIAFHDDIERELSSHGELFDVRDFAAKIAENATRVACLFHLFERGPAGQIGEAHMTGAVNVVTWHLLEAVRVFAELAAPEEIAHARLLSEWLQSGASGRLVGGVVPLVDVLRYGPNPVRKKQTRDAALELLADEQIAHVKLVRTDGESGTPNAIEVNPHLLGEVAR